MEKNSAFGLGDATAVDIWKAALRAKFSNTAAS